MLKVWSTGVAAFQLSSPAWEAVTVQLPAPVRVTSSARTVQAPVAAKPTARGEVVVALTANGGSPTVLGSSGPKVMAWSALPTRTVPVALASLYVASAARVTRTVQSPVPAVIWSWPSCGPPLAMAQAVEPSTTSQVSAPVPLPPEKARS